jgi:hypothetical protein
LSQFLWRPFPSRENDAFGLRSVNTFRRTAAAGLDFALAALDENEEDNDKKNSCNNANDGSCIHAFS